VEREKKVAEKGHLKEMSNPSKSKAKGTRFERQVADYLNERLPYPVDRSPLHGALDKGDISGVPDWALECKNVKNYSAGLAGYVREAEVEAVNLGVPFGAVVVSARGKGVEDSYVVVSLRQFVEQVR